MQRALKRASGYDQGSSRGDPLRLGYGTSAWLVIFPCVFENPEASNFLAVSVFHLLSMFCTFYSLYRSKNLAMAERQERVTFYDFAGPFLLLWFFRSGYG